MANDFSGDPSCKALWRFESGALTTDSIGGNTLTNHGVTEDTTNYMEGACCADFEEGSSQYFSIADASLDSEFPLKSGDTNKVISLAFWMKPETVGSFWMPVIDKMYNLTSGLSVQISYSGKVLQVAYYGNAGYSKTTTISPTLVAGHKYHVGIAIDGTNRTLLARLYDEYNDTAYDYSDTYTGSLGIANTQLAIGSWSTPYGNQYFDGLLDELVVFNELKTADDFDAIRAGTYEITNNTTADADFEVMLCDLQASDEGSQSSADADLTVMLVDVAATDGESDNYADADLEVMLAEVSSNVFDTVAYADLTAMLCDIEAYEGTRADLKVMLCEVSGVGLQGSIAYADLTVMLADVDGVLSSETVESRAYDTTANADLAVMLCGISGTGLTGAICNTDIELPFITLDADSSYESTIAYADLDVMLCELDAYVAEAIIITGWDGTTESVTGYALVLNLRNNALTEYDNYDFNSFAYFNGKYLAANSTGIFELIGDDDIGTDIDATIRTGLQDGGTSLRKGIVDAFFGVSCDDELSAKVITDGYISYAGSVITPRDTDLVTQRVKFGKGVRSRYLGTEISNTDGCDFNLESAELTVVPLTRQM